MSEYTPDRHGVNVYFLGNDKYGIITQILKEGINFYKALPEDHILQNWNKNYFNILILGDETISYDDKGKSFDKVIYYDKFMNDMLKVASNIYCSNYDYHYLVNALHKAKDSLTDAIMVGHSFSLFGVDDTKLNGRVVNLSLASQDLYYSISLAKDVIEANSNIKRCFIGTSYWSFYFDLSKSIHMEVSRVENVYYPILKDSHNYNYINKKKLPTLRDYADDTTKLIFDTDKLYKYLSKMIFENNRFYFNSMQKRVYLIGRDKPITFIQDSLRPQLGRARAEQHNKLIKYVQTKEENENLLKNFLLYLRDRNIEAVIVNFPTSNYYTEALNKGYFIEYYNNIIANLKEVNFEFVDLNKYSFDDGDFLDFDHMSEAGAVKVCNILNQLFR